MEELRRLNKMWLERTNPLRGLSISRATSMFDSARVWGSPRLQYAYNEIEATDPVLMTCVERRQSALAGLDYRFVASSSEDETLANEQRDALDRFVSGIENFSEVLEHMDLAFFRGFSHVQPIWDGTKVQHVNLLDSWNFLMNDEGQWLWNPACHETTGGLEPIGPDARLVSLVRKRAIDYPAIIIYIRHALGDRDWGRFIERYAIPPVHFEMAAGATDKDKPLYQEAGDAAHNGQNTIRPNGSHIDFAAEARGADPFTPFIEHQDKYIVLLATGGTLTSLAQADTGSLAGGAQMEVWREIVARDGVKIAEALNRSLFRRYLELEFPGRPMAARFELSNEAKPTADEIADLAGKLKTAGYTVDQAELEEAVGLKLVKDETPAPQLPFMNKEVKRLSDSAVKEPEPLNRSTAELLKAFAADMSPAGKAVKELLNALDKGEAASSPLVKEKASALLSRLPSLLPDDPATAAVIAEAMAAEFGAKIENKELPPRGKTSEDSTPGSFAPADVAGATATESPKAKAKREKHEWQVKAKTQGVSKMLEVKAGKDCHDFMPGLTLSNGKKISHIAFYQNGNAHARDHVQGDFGNGKFGYNHQEMMIGDRIPNTIANGTWYKQGTDYVAVEGVDRMVVLSPDGTGLQFKTTRMSAEDVKRIRESNYPRVFNKEDADDESHSTSAGM